MQKNDIDGRNTVGKDEGTEGNIDDDKNESLKGT